MEQLPGPGAAREQTEAACRGYNEDERQRIDESSSTMTRR
jgi:hypothetical protein